MDRRYSDAEVAELLSAAAQRESGGGKDGWTADQVLAMAAELGIDQEHVRMQFATKGLDSEPTAGTTEIIPSKTLAIGAPRNIVFRRRIRGCVPTFAIDDAAEDSRRMFSNVRRIESRADELIVDGKFQGVDARLYIESNPSHSVVTLSLDYRRTARWVHLLSQILITFIVFGNVSSSSPQVSFTGLLAAFFALAFVVGSGVTFILARQARIKAEKDFEHIAHRAARGAMMVAADNSTSPLREHPETRMHDGLSVEKRVMSSQSE